MRTAARTEAGLIRKINEDYYLCNPVKGLFIVADGMGGHLAGEVASEMAVKSIEKSLEKPFSDPLLALQQAVQEANRIIYANAQDDITRQGMGTTVTSAWIKGNKLFLAHVGDSRAYLIRNGSIKLLTDDHSYVGELIRSGNLTEKQAQNHPQRNVLMRAVGADAHIDIDLLEVNLEAGDYLLLCTDGLSNLVTGEEMLNSVLQEDSLEKSIDNLVELAYDRGASDNLTVIIVQF